MTLALKHVSPGVFHALYPSKCEGIETGKVMAWQPVEHRSGKSHRHYFSAVHEAWANLPEHLVDEFPSSEHLRKWALVKAGYCTVTKLAFKTNSDAIAACTLMSRMDSYSICEVIGGIVTVYQAESQSIPAMGRAKFQASKEDVFRVISELIGTEITEQMERAA